MKIKGSHAVITGGASGLGLSTAKRLVAAGAQVFLLDLLSSRGAELVEELGSQAHFLPVDVTKEDQVEDAVRTAAVGGPLRIVVNCAGIATPGKLVGKGGPIQFEAFMRVVNINLGGTLLVMAHAVTAMQQTEPIDNERGVIVNTASVAAFEGQVGQMAYAASKGAVASMTLPAARELASSQIRVVTIAPGLFETPMMAGLPQAVQDSLGSKTPHPNRLGRAEEYGLLAEHIIVNPMLNGETIRLDGAVRLEPR